MLLAGTSIRVSRTLWGCGRGQVDSHREACQSQEGPRWEDCWGLLASSLAGYNMRSRCREILQGIGKSDRGGLSIPSSGLSVCIQVCTPTYTHTGTSKKKRPFWASVSLLVLTHVSHTLKDKWDKLLKTGQCQFGNPPMLGNNVLRLVAFVYAAFV